MSNKSKASKSKPAPKLDSESGSSSEDVKTTKKTQKKVNTSDESSEDMKVKGKGKPTKKQESSDESSEDAKPKGKGKPAKKQESSDESSEDTKPKGKGKPINKKADDSSEDTKPKGKGQKKESSESKPKNDGPQSRIYKYEDIKVKEIEYIASTKEDKKQMTWFMNYNDSTTKQKQNKIFIKTGPIQTTGGGIPQLDSERVEKGFEAGGTYTSDEKRQFIKVPLDPKQDEAERLRKFATAMDERFGSEKMRKELFGKKWEEFIYSPLIKLPYEGGSEEEKKPKKKKKGDKDKEERPKFDTVKFKFDADYNNGNIKTSFMKVVDGKKTPMKLKTMTEVANEVTWLSTNEYIFEITRMWANKTAQAKGMPKMYGIVFKIHKLRYTPSEKSGYGFNGDFSDSQEESGKKKKNAKSKAKEASESEDSAPKSKGKGAKKPADDSGSEDSAPKGKGGKKPAKKEDSESEDSAPKGKGKGGKKPVDDSGSEDSAPKGKGGKKPAKKEESESEDSAPKKPTKKGSKK